MKKLFTLFLFALLAITSAWALDFSQTYSYGLEGWSLTDYTDGGDYYRVPKTGSTSSDAVISGIFLNKTIKGNVTVTLNVATYGGGTNPSASTFTLYADDKATTAVTATKGGTLPTSSDYTNVTYTVTQANASSLTTDLMIRITKPGKQIRLKSITVKFSYEETTGGKTVSSLALSGEPTKTEYYTNEAFSTAGLTATAYYTDGTNADVTSQSTFECDPATFTTAGAQTVTVKAKYNDTYSNEGTYNVTVAEASTNTYTLVTSVDQLSVGDQVIFSNTAHTNLMGQQNTNNRGTVDTEVETGITWNDDYSSVTISNDNVAIATLEAGTKEGTFAFKVNEGYLYAASSSSNHLKSKASKDDNASAKISISSNQATITFQGDKTRNILRYNSSDKLFSCYESGQQAVLIYKAGAVVVKPAAPTFNPASGTTFTDALDVSITPAAGCSVKYQINDGGAITSTESPVIVKLSKTTTITAWSVDADGVESMAATATYTKVDPTSTNTYLLVTSDSQLESGAKYVLVNKTGDKIASAFSTDKITTVGSSGNYDLDTNNNIVTVLSDEVNVFTFTGDATNGWTITDKKNVVYTSSNQNELSSGTATLHTISISTDGTVKISAKSYPTRQWKFNSSMFRNYGTGTGSAPYLYKAGAVVVKPAAPTFNPESGTAFDTETATVTITAPEGCTLKYTVGSGEEQTSASNTAEVTVSPTAYTITAKSVDAEGVESNEATATYTFNVVAHVKNIAEFLALPDKTTAIFDNPVVVLYDYSQPSNSGTNCEYIWVKDESGQTNLYLPEAFDGTNHVAHYENGDVIPAGFKATKNLYDVGKFYQAFVDATNRATLQDATLKRLADPVTITFSEFKGLTITDDDLAEWNNTYVMIPRVNFSLPSEKQSTVSQDGTTATSSVFYNKYSDEGAKKKDGTSAVVEMRTDGASVEYNVYGILQVFGTKWEIMPIRFVEYSAQTVTLKELVELGNANSTKETTEYTILNDLRGVRALPGNVILAKSKFDDAATEESVNAKAQEDYDQSNWVEIVLPSSVSAADYVDRIITGLSVKGYYKNTTNPRLEASAAPTAGGATGAYTRNAMCPANFMGTSQKCNDETLTQEHGDFFFMTPKPNECVQVVWAVYNSTAKAFYIPAAQGSINSHGFKGAFSINWAYNAGGKITNLTDGTTYQFAAVVKKPEATAQSTKRKVAYDGSQDLSKDYVVYPLNLDANTVTGITETTGAKTVKSVRYFNIMGVELAEPTAGVNIVLTTYTDGTTHSQKILK